MEERKYPRKFVRNLACRDPAKILFVDRPRAQCRRFDDNREQISDGITEDEVDRVVEQGFFAEVFDHHEDAEELAALEKRCAVVYLKSVVKTQKAENEKLRNLLKRALFSSNRAQKKAMIKEFRELLGEAK